MIRTWFISFILIFGPSAEAQLAGSDALQLQRLIQLSESQLESVKEMLKVSRQDANTLAEARNSLAKLSAGLDHSIEKYQGTETYERALLLLQKEDLSNQAKKNEKTQAGDDHFLKFQSESLHANSESLDRVQSLRKTLGTAESGFVPKIQSEAALGNWQTGARISTQLSEILGVLHAMQDSKGVGHMSGLALLVKGSEEQNRKQKEAALHAR